jgi:hypothetical protein
MGYEGVMRMPIRAFWVFCRQIDRLHAAERLGQLQVANLAQGGEEAQEFASRLTLTIGEVIEPDVVVEELDRAGLEDLRSLA